MNRTVLTHAKGFTLIELSIVLVIIGLIVGGVLVGQDMIKAAQVRATITQVEKFNQAANTFFGKYGALPGDLNTQVANAFGFAPRGRFGGEGDGDGVIEGVNQDVANSNYGFIEAAGETVMFWSDLTYANGQNINLIEGTFRLASPTAPAPIPSSAIAQYFPAAKLGGGNYFYAFSQKGWSVIGPTNWLGLSALSAVTAGSCAYCATSTPGLTVKQAYDIDKKVDDGLPQSGRVLAFYADSNTFGAAGVGYAASAVSPSASTCFDTTSQLYSIAVSGGNNVNCAISFRLQAGD